MENNYIYIKFFNMNELYKEMMERLKFPESLKKSQIIEGRILELSNCIVRIQQMLIKDIK